MEEETEFSETMTSIALQLESVTTDDESSPSSQQQTETSPASKERKPSINFNEKLLMLNLPEKIVIIIDTLEEPECTPFKQAENNTCSVHDMIKRVMDIFIQNKLAINRKHAFAIMTMNSNKLTLHSDFTGDVKTLLVKLNQITEVDLNTKTEYNLDNLFENIHDITVKNPSSTVHYSYRAILIYRQSNIVPKFNLDKDYMQELMKIPWFYLDILYIHELPNNENQVEDIYSSLAKLAKDNGTYIFEIGRNAKKLHEHVARLLAHPMQRAPLSCMIDEENANYKNMNARK